MFLCLCIWQCLVRLHTALPANLIKNCTERKGSESTRFHFFEQVPIRSVVFGQTEASWCSGLCLYPSDSQHMCLQCQGFGIIVSLKKQRGKAWEDCPSVRFCGIYVFYLWWHLQTVADVLHVYKKVVLWICLYKDEGIKKQNRSFFSDNLCAYWRLALQNWVFKIILNIFSKSRTLRMCCIHGWSDELNLAWLGKRCYTKSSALSVIYPTDEICNY